MHPQGNIYEKFLNFKKAYAKHPVLCYNGKDERGETVYSGRSTTWSGKVALPYPSDYGYAVDFNKCKQNLSKYTDSICTSNNWIKTIIANSGKSGWLLTPYDDSKYIWAVGASGYITLPNGDVTYDRGYFGSGGFVCNVHGVVPTLYLSSDEILESGDGSSSNPYKLG